MRKKIVLLLTATAVAMSLLSGCGNKTGNSASTSGKVADVSTSDKKITVSDMLEHVLKDNNGKAYIYTTYVNATATEAEYIVGKSIQVQPYQYTGDSLTQFDNITMGEVANGTKPSEKSNGRSLHVGNYAVITDSTGNNIAIEALTHTYTTENNMQPPETASDGDGQLLSELPGYQEYVEKYNSFKPENKEDCALYFGSFSRTTIYNKTFMVFTSVDKLYKRYTLIEDTDYTKDKTVVYDSLSKNGLIIDSKDIDFNITK